MERNYQTTGQWIREGRGGGTYFLIISRNGGQWYRDPRSYRTERAPSVREEIATNGEVFAERVQKGITTGAPISGRLQGGFSAMAFESKVVGHVTYKPI